MRDPDTGIYYTDEEKTGLQLVPKSTIELFVPKSVQFIVGGSIDTAALRECRNSLTSLKFEADSNLAKIEKYGCCNLNSLEILDLSNCTKLEVIHFAAFFNSRFSSLILPPNVKTIESSAFGKCVIREVEFPDSLESLGGWSSETGSSAFMSNPYLKLIIHETSNLSSVGDCAFQFSNIPEVYIPKKLNSIGNKAFANTQTTTISVHTGNEKYSTPDGKSLVTKMENGKMLVYLVCRLTGNYTVPEGVTAIGSGALAGAQISHLFLPESLNSIGYQALTGSTISTISMPKTVKSISSEAMSYMYNLTSIDLPNISVLQNNLFEMDNKLEEVIIPSTVTSINNNVFKGCTSLTYVFVPKSVVSIGSGSFSNVHPNIEIVFENGSSYSIKNEILFNAAGTNLIQYIGSKSSFEYVVPEKVEKIMASAFESKGLSKIDFSHTTNLTVIESRSFAGTLLQSLDIPLTVTSFGKAAFSGISTLTKFTYQGSISEIPESCFELCAKLQFFSLLDSVTQISKKAFYGCRSMTSIEIGPLSSLQRIKESAFADSGLQAITFRADVSLIESYAFKGSALESIVFETEKLEAIPVFAFAGCNNLESVDLTLGIRSVESSSFEGCKTLSTVTIGPTVESIAVFAFRNCENLEYVSFASKSVIRSIVGTAFVGCFKLEKLVVPKDNEQFISEDGLLYDKNKTEIVLCLPSRSDPNYTLPNSVLSVNPEAFSECTKLQVFNIGDGSQLQSIGFQAFAGCTMLNYVKLPDRMIIIGQGAFDRCTGFTCESFDYPPMMRPKLESLKLPSYALDPCPTGIFTTTPSFDNIFFELLLPLCNYSEGDNK